MDTSTEPTTVPIGLSFFASGVKSVLRFVDRDHKNVVAWHGYASGGHDAAHQVPDVPVADLRGFHGDLFADHADI
jgi:epoxide hydrolase